MDSDDGSTLWEGAEVPPTVAVGTLAPNTTVGVKSRRVI